MSVVVDGSREGVTIVLVHGVGLDHQMWAPMSGLLAGHHRVVSYDLLGHGNAAPLDVGSDLGTFASQLEVVLDDLDIASCVLVGFSLGALIAQRFVLDHPERVDALVLVNSVFDRSPADRAAVLNRVEAVRNGGYQATIETALERWFSPHFTSSKPAVVASVRQRLLDNDVTSYAIAYSIFAIADSGLAAEAGSITTPTLVLTGADDLRSTPAMTCALAAALPHARAVVVPGLCHLGPLEDPPALAAVIEEFVADVLPPRSRTHPDDA